MNHDKVRVALVGCGGMAARIRRRYVQSENAELCLLVDTNEELVRQASAELGDIPWTTRFEDVLSSSADAVDISTPNFLHAPQAIAALRAGKHVLIQKPLAPTVREAEDIVAAARESGRQAGMYMSFYDNPLFHEAKAIITQGLIGKLTAIRCRGAGNSASFVKPGNWRNSAEKTGGGSFIQLTLHPINMAQWLADDEIRQVAAFSHNRFSPYIGGDDVTMAACYFDSGILGTLESSYCGYQFSLSLYGTEGYITITDNSRVELMLNGSFNGEYLKVQNPGETILEFPLFSTAEVQIPGNPYNQHEAFIRAIRNGEPVPIPADIGLRDLKIVQAVYESAREQRFVEVR